MLRDSKRQGLFSQYNGLAFPNKWIRLQPEPRGISTIFVIDRGQQDIVVVSG